MSDTALQSKIPPWTFGWRLRRALAFADLTTEQAAEQIDVDRTTISRWQNDIGKMPKRIWIRELAELTGVPYEWLLDGDVSAGGHAEDSESNSQSFVFAARQESLMARIGSLQLAG